LAVNGQLLTNSLQTTHNVVSRTRLAELRELKQGEHVEVELANLFIFLWRDGTIITFYAKPSPEVFAPILARLRSRDSILRTSADASILVHGLLDLGMSFPLSRALEGVLTISQWLIML
jgi:hypothetical protein